MNDKGGWIFALSILFVCLLVASAFIYGDHRTYIRQRNIIASQQYIIESLRSEIKTYQAIGNIIDSRCVDVMEPRPMEVGE